MCGIIGLIGKDDVVPRLVEGLRRLEYRGYDSAGLTILIKGHIERRRAKGKLSNLERLLHKIPLTGMIGLGHTRWATHGIPSEYNAHPHATEKVAVVHNGIIENFQNLRTEMTDAGHVMTSDTDTEILAHLVTHYLNEGLDPVAATRKALKRLEGAFALGFIFCGHSDLMIAARQGSPLAIGYGEDEMYIASDALTLAPLTKKVTYLEDGDWAVVRSSGAQIYDSNDTPVIRKVQITALSGAMCGKGGYRHFMIKEIYEQPQVIGDTLLGFLNPAAHTITLPHLPFDLAKITRITGLACGTAYYALCVAKYWFEQIARIPMEVDIASEFRYRETDMTDGGMSLFVSQSGETADTLASLRYAKAQCQKILSIINVPESTIARESDAVFHTYAGPEIGVASTKAFTTQLTVLALLVIAMGRAKNTIDDKTEVRLSIALEQVPACAAKILRHDERLKELAHEIIECRDVLYLGRGSSFPLALEGALKLKEISYIHAEGYAAGEMKHGPIALIDDGLPVIVIAPSDKLFDKVVSNVQEVVARGGRVIFFSDQKGCAHLENTATTIVLPEVDPFVAPILYAIPVQLLAYHIAVLKGTDVDQPRNLAKSVTVE